MSMSLILEHYYENYLSPLIGERFHHGLRYVVMKGVMVTTALLSTPPSGHCKKKDSVPYFTKVEESTIVKSCMVMGSIPIYNILEF